MFNIQNFTSQKNSINVYIHKGASKITFIYAAIISFVFLILLIFDHLLLAIFTGIDLEFLIQAGLQLTKTCVTIGAFGLWIAIFSFLMVIPFNHFGKKRLIYSLIAIVGFIIAAKPVIIVFALFDDFEFMQEPFSKFYKMTFFLPFLYLWVLSRIQKFENENTTNDWGFSDRFKTWLAHCLFMKNVSNKNQTTIKEIAAHSKSTALKQGKNQLKREISHLNASLLFGQIIALLKIITQQTLKVGEYLNPTRFATELDFSANMFFMWFKDSVLISIFAFIAYRVFAIAIFIIGKFIQFRNTSLEMGLIGGVFFSIISFAIMLGASFYNFEGILFFFFNPLTLFVIGFIFGLIYKLSLPKPPMPIINSYE